MKLRGSELIIAAVIENAYPKYYEGGIKGLMLWTGTSKQNVITALKRLQNKSIIVKYEVWNVGRIGKRCYYKYNKQ